MLPIAMLTGALFYKYVVLLSFLTPYLIFTMLLVTYCKLAFRELKFTRLHLWLIIIQLLGSLLVYFICYFFDPLLAEGVMICVLAPTATAAAVITGMLGGSVASLAAFSLLSNLTVAIAAPAMFSFMGNNSELPFLDSFFHICRQVGPLLIFPFVCAVLLDKLLPGVHRKLKSMQSVSFYLWSVGLMIVTGKTVYFIAVQDSSNYTEELLIALCSLVICIIQFMGGRRLGRYFGDKVAGGQALGQKNTILAIWMAQVYLLPLASIGPASYVLWQNIINSYQLWKKRKKDDKIRNLSS